MISFWMKIKTRKRQVFDVIFIVGTWALVLQVCFLKTQRKARRHVKHRTKFELEWKVMSCIGWEYLDVDWKWVREAAHGREWA